MHICFGLGHGSLKLFQRLAHVFRAVGSTCENADHTFFAINEQKSLSVTNEISES